MPLAASAAEATDPDIVDERGAEEDADDEAVPLWKRFAPDSPSEPEEAADEPQRPVGGGGGDGAGGRDESLDRAPDVHAAREVEELLVRPVGQLADRIVRRGLHGLYAYTCTCICA